MSNFNNTKESQKSFLMDVISELMNQGVRVASEDLEYLYSRYLAGRTTKQIVTDFNLKKGVFGKENEQQERVN